MKLANYFEEKWVKKVHVKWEPKEGLFSKGTSLEIARAATRGHDGDIGAAIKSLVFFVNRGGSKLDEAIKAKVESAIHQLQKKNK